MKKLSFTQKITFERYAPSENIKIGVNHKRNIEDMLKHSFATQDDIAVDVVMHDFTNKKLLIRLIITLCLEDLFRISHDGQSLPDAVSQARRSWQLLSLIRSSW